MPGSYSISLSKSVNGELTELVAPNPFLLKSLGGSTLRADNVKELADFHKDVAELQRKFMGTTQKISEISNTLKYIRKAVYTMPAPLETLEKNLLEAENNLSTIRKSFYGDRIKSRLDQPTLTPLGARIWGATAGFDSTSEPTTTARDAYSIAQKGLQTEVQNINNLLQQIEVLEESLEKAGAPYTPGRAIDWNK